MLDMLDLPEVELDGKDDKDLEELLKLLEHDIEEKRNERLIEPLESANKPPYEEN